MNIIDELQWRDAINQQTDAEGLRELTETKAISVLRCRSDRGQHAYRTLDSVYDAETLPAGRASACHPDWRRNGYDWRSKWSSVRAFFADVGASARECRCVNGTDEKVVCDRRRQSGSHGHNYDWTHKINVIEFLRDYGKTST